MRIILFFLVLFITLTGRSNTIIYGTAKGAEKKDIKISTYTDQVTYITRTLDISQIDSAGKFTLTCDDILFTTYCVIEIDNFYTEIYLLPNHTHQLTIAERKYPLIDERMNIYVLPKEILEVTYADDADINNLIKPFNTLFNTFIDRHYEDLSRYRKKYLVDSLDTELKKIPHADMPFIHDFITYKIASVKQLCYYYGPTSFFQDYIQDKPILYNQVEYMNFFNNYFSKYIISTLTSISANMLIEVINREQPNYLALLDTLGKDTLLRNEVLRELVLLKNLYELYYLPEISKKNILYYLNTLSTTTKFKEHKQLALNIAYTILRLKPESIAPDMIATNTKGEKLTLYHDLLHQDKYVYLFFWHNTCVRCKTELALIGKLQEEFSSSVSFVGINMDDNITTLINYHTNSPSNWMSLFGGKTPQLIDTYDVKGFPLGVLMDEDGTIMQYPANKPSEELRDLLLKLTYTPKATKTKHP